MSSRSRLLLVSLGLLALPPLLYLALAPRRLPPVALALPPLCELRAGPCVARFEGGGAVAFQIEPRSLPPLQPLQLSVQVEDLDVNAVEIEIAGTDMNMGYNRVQLMATENGIWVGQTTLPVCVRSRMNWEAKIYLSSPRGLMVAPFRFDTYSQSAGYGS